MPQAGFDPPAQSDTSYEADTLPTATAIAGLFFGHILPKFVHLDSVL